jgi:long-chain fatty acid transport protein
MKWVARIFEVTIAFAAGVAFSPASWALGFRNPDQDARATAQGEAFVAQADAPSAIYYNPGGLTQVEGTEVSGTSFLVLRNIRFSGAVASEKLNKPAYSGALFASSDFGTEKFRFGLGINVPFGNTVDWGKNSSFRYIVTDSSLQVRNYQPTIAYKFNQHLSLGVGLNIYDADTELNRLVPFSILINPLLPDGRFHFGGNGQAFGATAGLLYRVNEQHSLGVVYRSPFSVDFHGHAAVKDDPTGLFGRSPASAQINFPQSVAAGYAFRPIQKLKLELDIEWTNWETLNTLRLHSPNPAFANSPDSSIPFNWRDSFFYEFGAQYQIDKHWAARAGYIYSENTVPNNTFSPTLPDSDRHVFSVGIGFTQSRFKIDAMYQYSLSTDRTVTGSPDANFDGTGDLDGKWKSDAHAFMLTSTVKF